MSIPDITPSAIQTNETSNSVFFSSSIDNSGNFYAFYGFKQHLTMCYFGHTFSLHFQMKTSFYILPLAFDDANHLHSKTRYHFEKRKQKENCLRLSILIKAVSRKCESKHHSLTTSTFADVKRIIFFLS